MPTADPQALSAGSLKPFRPALTFTFFNAINWQIALGAPMLLLLTRLGADTFEYGLCASFVFLLTPVQVLSSALLPRYGFKRLMMSGWGLRALFLLPAIALAWLARGGSAKPWMVGAMVASVFGFTFFRSLGSCAWMPWIYKLLPEKLRGRYFATEQTVSGVASVGILLTCTLLFRVLPACEALMIEFALAFVGAGLSFLALRRMADVERPAEIGFRDTVVRTPGICLRPGAFRRYLWAACAFGFATAAIAPFGIYYFTAVSDVSESRILFFNTMQFAGVIAMSLLVRGEIDRIGPRPFFFAALLVHGAVAVFWLALLVFDFNGQPFFPWVCLVLGMGAALWTSANLNYLPMVVPAEDRPLVLAVYGAVTSVASGLAAVLWGAFLKKSGAGPGMNLPVFVAFFAFVLASVGGLLWWMRRFAYVSGNAEKFGVSDLLLRPDRAFGFFLALVDTSLSPADNDRRLPPRS